MNTKSSRTSRLEIWRDIVSAKREPELDEVTAGRDAEKALRSLVTDHLSWKAASIFHSKRVPRDTRAQSRGRYEIDLVVISPNQISAIEIKNWSGRLRIDGDRWVQERRNGGEIAHENPLSKNKEKLDCLCAVLESRNIRVPPARVCRVIFWNKNITVPIEVAKRDEIVMHHELDRFLTTQKATGFAERFLISVLELCLDQEASMIATDGFFKAIPSRDYSAAVETITSLETFDKIELLGGRVISGDLLEIRVGQDRLPLKTMPSGSEVKVVCNRSKVILFLLAILGSAPMISLSHPFSTISISPRDKVLFHQAGEPKPEEIEFGRISRLVRG
ncbi:nuclease-related domain-containing protein [Pararhodobacter aggregans]|nr:nuclease-related domain-containing protein [Pararhodobacter aggregans]PTW99456.1 nuclease-like protein [Pararhodobacter aggregans]